MLPSSFLDHVQLWTNLPARSLSSSLMTIRYLIPTSRLAELDQGEVDYVIDIRIDCVYKASYLCLDGIEGFVRVLDKKGDIITFLQSEEVS